MYDAARPHTNGITMNIAQVALLTVALSVGSPASASVINLREISCKDFVGMSKDDLTYTLAFLDGYFRTEDDPLIVDQDKSRAKDLAEYCIANPTEGLIDAADKMLRKQ